MNRIKNIINNKTDEFDANVFWNSLEKYIEILLKIESINNKNAKNIINGTEQLIEKIQIKKELDALKFEAKSAYQKLNWRKIIELADSLSLNISVGGFNFRVDIYNSIYSAINIYKYDENGEANLLFEIF